jgi:hypothetical protein
VAVYKFVKNQWKLVGAPLNPGPANQIRLFGSALGLDKIGQTLFACAAEYMTVPAGQHVGACYFYKYSKTQNAYALAQGPITPGGTARQVMGASGALAANGKVAIAGAPDTNVYGAFYTMLPLTGAAAKVMYFCGRGEMT